MDEKTPGRAALWFLTNRDERGGVCPLLPWAPTTAEPERTPGAAEEEIQIEVEEDILSLETGGDSKYAKEILLPAAVDAASLQKTFRNGILELRLKKE